MEEEAREILRTAAKSEQGVNAPLGSRIAKRFAGIGLDGEIAPLRGRKAEPVFFKK
jgi:plasmid stability protein